MMSTLACLAVLQLAPSQADQLQLTNARLTTGVLGPTHSRTQFLPGDLLTLSFDLDGITVSDEGKVRYRTVTQITDAAGKDVHVSKPRELEALASLGGGKVPAYAQVDIGLNQPEGTYNLKVTVTDVASGKTQSLTQKFEVLPKGFGAIRGSFTHDREGSIPACQVTEGENVWINFVLVGFSRASGGQPNVVVEMRILDDQGKPTVAKPFTGVIDKDVPPAATSLPAQFLISLNRAGAFKVELKATDQVSSKSISGSYPLTVLPRK
jgi:hypothetical protein